jgi:hypothetical protein
MATLPRQYQAGTPTQEIGNLSPLQLALAYFMDLGQVVPFSVNTEFINVLKVFSSSGLVTPSDLNLENVGNVSVIADGPWVKIIRRAENCGPIEIERYDSVIVGSRADLVPDAWSFDTTTIRGGSVSTGAGGPWGTGGLSSAFPGPCNAIDRPPPIIASYNDYGGPGYEPTFDTFYGGYVRDGSGNPIAAGGGFLTYGNPDWALAGAFGTAAAGMASAVTLGAQTISNGLNEETQGAGFSPEAAVAASLGNFPG